MKARVSKNLKGTIVLKSVSNYSMKANQEFDITADQYWADDVQRAVTKGWVICAKAPKRGKTIQVTNVSLGSVSIPGVGVLRAGRTTEMDKKFAKSTDILKLKDTKKIVFGKAKAPEEPDNKMRAHKAVAADGKKTFSVEDSLNQQAQAIRAAKKSKMTPRQAENALLLDLDSDKPESEFGEDIKWVDVEQEETSAKERPQLKVRNPASKAKSKGKSKGKGRK